MLELTVTPFVAGQPTKLAKSSAANRILRLEWFCWPPAISMKQDLGIKCKSRRAAATCAGEAPDGGETSSSAEQSPRRERSERGLEIMLAIASERIRSVGEPSEPAGAYNKSPRD